MIFVNGEMATMAVIPGKVKKRRNRCLQSLNFNNIRSEILGSRTLTVRRQLVVVAY